MTTKIYDKNISLDDFAAFEKCTVSKDGKEITFVYKSGHQYTVPLKYLIKWFPYPHYIKLGSKIIEWDKTKIKNINWKKAVIKKYRRVLINTAIRLYMSDGTIYDIPWDTVLMACEPKYEHFGGLTKKSKKITHEWFSKIQN